MVKTEFELYANLVGQVNILVTNYATYAHISDSF